MCAGNGKVCGLASKEFTRNAGKLGLIPGLVRSPGEGKGYPLQYSGLENSMGYIVQGVAKSWTQLSDFQFHFHNYKREAEKREPKRCERICPNIHGSDVERGAISP